MGMYLSTPMEGLEKFPVQVTTPTMKQIEEARAEKTKQHLEDWEKTWEKASGSGTGGK